MAKQEKESSKINTTLIIGEKQSTKDYVQFDSTNFERT